MRLPADLHYLSRIFLILFSVKIVQVFKKNIVDLNIMYTI